MEKAEEKKRNPLKEALLVTFASFLVFFFIGLLVKQFLDFLSLPDFLGGKDYYFPEVNIAIYIHPNRSFDVIEQRTYKFKGDFHWATYFLEKHFVNYTVAKSNESIQEYEKLMSQFSIANFSISDEKGPYLKKKPSFDEAPGTFTFWEDANSYNANFFYSAADTEKKFTISYRVVGGIRAYSDVANFYWKLIGTGWSKKTQELRAYIYLPSEVDESELKAFGYGPSVKVEKIIDFANGSKKAKGVFISASNIPPHTFVEASIIFPSSIMSQSDRIPINASSTILSMSSSGSASNLLDSLIAFLTLNLDAVDFSLACTGILVGVYLYLVYGMEPQPTQKVIYQRDIPEDTPPAIVGYLTRLKVLPEDLVASVLYLVRKKYIRIEVKEDENNYLLFKQKVRNLYFYKTAEDPSRLLPHLGVVYSLLFNVIGRGKDFTSTEEIKESQKSWLLKRSMIKSLKDFEAKVKKDCRREWNYFEDNTKIIFFYRALSAVFIPLIAVTLELGLEVGMVSPAICLFITPLLLIFGIIAVLLEKGLERKTQLGADAAAKWIGLKNFLKDFSNLSNYPVESIVLWEDYLVYATTFGVAHNVLKAMKMNIPIDKISKENSSILYQMISSGGYSDILAFSDLLQSSFKSLGRSVGGGAAGRGGIGGGGGGGGSGGGAG